MRYNWWMVKKKKGYNWWMHATFLHCPYIIIKKNWKRFFNYFNIQLTGLNTKSKNWKKKTIDLYFTTSSLSSNQICINNKKIGSFILFRRNDNNN